MGKTQLRIRAFTTVEPARSKTPVATECAVACVNVAGHGCVILFQKKDYAVLTLFDKLMVAFGVPVWLCIGANQDATNNN